MGVREKISWFIHQKIVGKLYTVKFYVTALNTFDSGPPGIFGLEDAKKVTRALLKEAAPLLKRRLPFGVMSRLKALAKSFVLATMFWSAHAESLEQEMERQKKEKQKFFRLLLENNVPIPLALIFGNKLPLGLSGTPIMHTLQDMMRYIEKRKMLPKLSVEAVYGTDIEAFLSPEEKAAFTESAKWISSTILVSDLSDLGLDSWLSEHLSIPY